MENYVWGHFFVCKYLILSVSLKTSLLNYIRQLKNNQNQMNTTGAQNLKEFSNAAGWLSGFL